MYYCGGMMLHELSGLQLPDFFLVWFFFFSRNLIKLSPLCQCATHNLQNFYLYYPEIHFFILQCIFSLMLFFPLNFSLLHTEMFLYEKQVALQSITLLSLCDELNCGVI